MKLLLPLGMLVLVMSFCNRINEMVGQVSKTETNTNTANASSGNPSDPNKADDSYAEKPEFTSAQQEIVDNGEKIKWSEQDIRWTAPKNWKKLSVSKTSFNYQSPDMAFLLANISNVPNDFPAETSLKATYDSSLQQLKNGKYEKVRYLEIDGIKGVEFTETMPEDNGDPRRHQWIAYRTYQGNVQMLNIMLSTKGNNFEDHRDDFPAILYSMEIGK